MKQPLFALAVLAFAGVAPLAVAQTQVMPVSADVDTDQIETKILAVDTAARTITVETPNGPALVHVPDKVKNLGQIKAGDLIRITYQLAVATAIKRGGTAIRSDVSAQSAGQVQQKGTIAAGSGMKQEVVTANVTAVDAAKNRITVQGPQGRVVTMKLPEPGLASQIKVGDQLEVAYRIAVAVQVLPAPKK